MPGSVSTGRRRMLPPESVTSGTKMLRMLEATTAQIGSSTRSRISAAAATTPMKR